MKKFMMNKDPSMIEGLWPVEDFRQAYLGYKDSFKRCAVAYLTDDEDNRKIVVMVIRMIIENGVLINNQKYIVGIRFYSYGDMATLDFISLDKSCHREICAEHLKRMGWPLLDQQMTRHVNVFNDDTRTPFLFGEGTFVEKNKKSPFINIDKNEDKILFLNIKNISLYLANFAMGKEAPSRQGEDFIQQILQIMLRYKLQKNFYEKLVEETYKKTPIGEKTFSAQQLGALLSMKVIDRTITDGYDMWALLVEEMSNGGIGGQKIRDLVRNFKIP